MTEHYLPKGVPRHQTQWRRPTGSGNGEWKNLVGWGKTQGGGKFGGLMRVFLPIMKFLAVSWHPFCSKGILTLLSFNSQGCCNWLSWRLGDRILDVLPIYGRGMFFGNYLPYTLVFFLPPFIPSFLEEKDSSCFGRCLELARKHFPLFLLPVHFLAQSLFYQRCSDLL